MNIIDFDEDSLKDFYKIVSTNVIRIRKEKKLSQLKLANAEKIAKFLKISQTVAVSKRMSELERDELVYKPGTKSKTSSGCEAYNYELTEAGRNAVEGVVDAKQIDDGTKKYVQLSLNL